MDWLSDWSRIRGSVRDRLTKGERIDGRQLELEWMAGEVLQALAARSIPFPSSILDANRLKSPICHSCPSCFEVAQHEPSFRCSTKGMSRSALYVGNSW